VGKPLLELSVGGGHTESQEDRRSGQLCDLNISTVGWMKGRKGLPGDSNLGGLRSSIWCVEMQRLESTAREEEQTAARLMVHVFG